MMAEFLVLLEALLWKRPCAEADCAVCHPRLRNYKPGGINLVGNHSQDEIYEVFAPLAAQGRRLGTKKFSATRLSVGG